MKVLQGELRNSVLTTIAITGICLVLLAAFHGNYYDSIFTLSVSFGIVVVGMVLQVGYSHQLAFQQAVFMMFGAYGVGVLNTKYHVSMGLSMIVVVVAAAAIGTIMGWYVTKVPGFALALATLFFATIAGNIVSYSNYLGSQEGLGPLPFVWSAAGYSGGVVRSGAIAILLLGGTAFVCSRIMASGIGLELSLLASNERMAEAIGVITRRRKLEVFVIGSAAATLGGAAFASTQQFVSPVTFSSTVEITLLVMLFLGGRASILGALIGAIGLEFLTGVSNWIGINQGIIEGVLITVVLLVAPAGLIGLVQQGFGYLRAALRGAPRRAPADELMTPELAALEADGATSLGSGGLNGTMRPQGRSVLPARPRSGDEVRTVKLECRDLTKRFGGLTAVDHVSLLIEGTGIHAICGPNGAGKSTLFELVAGGLRADGGQVLLDDVDITHMPAHSRAQLGIARTLQTVRLMNARSVLDNVAVAALPSHNTFMLRSVYSSGLSEARDLAWDTLNRLGVSTLADRRPSSLTLEGQRMVELARAMVSDPKLLLLDEPASGLSVDQRHRLADRLLQLAERATVVLVEHDLQLVADLASEIFVLIDGRLMFTGNSTEFLESDVVRRELMGLIEARTAI